MVKKAGTILLNKDQTKVGIIYRKYNNDYSFPKGHLEENESLKECALRETEEETGIIAELLLDKEIGVISYDNNEGRVDTYMYLAIEKDKSKNICNDGEVDEFIWVNKDKIKDLLTYQNLKDFWEDIYEKNNLYNRQ